MFARLIGAVALLAVLAMPALHAMHLRLAEAADVAVVDARAGDHAPAAPPHHHDVTHCAICASAQSIHAGTALFDLAIACAFEAPAPFPPALYLAPSVDAFVPILASPRGPPARA